MSLRVFPVAARDFVGLAVLGTIALTTGVLTNKFRTRPLPLVYATKASRLEQAVARVAASPLPAAPPTETAVLAPPPASLAPAPVDGPALAVPTSPAANVYEIELPEFQQRLAEPGAVLVDARPEIFHRFGHIPGALALPRDEFEVYYPKHRAKLEPYKNQEILVYCQGSSCEDSHLVASALTKLGYTRLAVFVGGWNAWTQQGLPQEK
jgi:rhodanese-related sulfurtransferase